MCWCFIKYWTVEGVIWHMDTVKLQYAVPLPCFLHNYLFQFYFRTGQWDLELPWMSYKHQLLEQIVNTQIIMGWNISEVIYEHLTFQTHMPDVLDTENTTSCRCHAEKQKSYQFYIKLQIISAHSIFSAEGESVLLWLGKSRHSFVTATIKHIL